MKDKERKISRRLRNLGWSLRAITKHVKCSKSSISRWVEDIPLTEEQIAKLKSNQDRGRAAAANHPNGPKTIWAKIRSDIVNSATKEIPSGCPIHVLRFVGSALYWGEGSKSERNMVSFSNTDPHMVGLMMRFFKDVCNVSDSKFRGVVHIHPHLDKAKAQKYWSEVSEIPISQFHKTQTAISRASKGKKDNLPFGTFKIVICDVRLQSRLKGWIEGMKKWSKIRALSSVG